MSGECDICNGEHVEYNCPEAAKGIDPEYLQELELYKEKAEKMFTSVIHANMWLFAKEETDKACPVCSYSRDGNGKHSDYCFVPGLAETAKKLGEVR